MNFKQKPKDFQILFLDMNSFFASIEQQVQPPLRGRPIGITPYCGNTGCIISPSREAKICGVKTGNSVGQAKSICPGIKIVEARPALYLIYHRELKKVIADSSPFYQPQSVDEFSIELSPSEQNFRRVEAASRQIKQAIRERVGDFLTCSVGAGPNKFLAKMAAEKIKPDGFFVVTLGGLKKFYADLGDLTEISGINVQMEKHLRRFNINTPLQFYEKNLAELVKILNHWGRLWYFRLRGWEVDDYVLRTQNIGHSHVLAPQRRQRCGAESTLKKLIFKVGYRLRKKDCCAGGVSILVKFMDRTVFAKSRRVGNFCDNFTLTKNVFNLLQDCQWRTKPILVAVSVFNLTKNLNSYQISIFPEIEKLKKASVALDELNDKFGAETIYPASIHQAKLAAPDRIPFGQPRYDIRYQ